LTVQRLTLAQDVAAAKFATGQPIEDKFDHITTQMILEFKYMDDVPHLRRENIDDLLDRQLPR
jgi:chorismate mutase